jgi:TolA-binding protein
VTTLFMPGRAVGWGWLRLVALAWLTAAAAAGCVGADKGIWKNWFAKSGDTPGEGPTDSFVLRGDGLETDKSALAGTPQGELEGAKTLFREKKYGSAENIFHRLAKNTKNPPTVLEEALFYEAECQYLQGNLRSAEPTYKKLLTEFRYGRHKDDANRRLFDIANFWLDDTRKVMQAYEEKRDGKRWFIMPASYVHFSKDKPLLDMEGHALQALEEVRLNDLKGELGERALFYIATVKFFREDYKDADYYYSQLYENYPNSSLAPKAIKQAIVCKQLVAGGSMYDGRTAEEARKLIDTAARAYPQLNAREDTFLQKSLVAIHLQQADRDFRIAEFYRRTGHPGSAYFYYELVRRRYPETEYAKKATERITDVRAKLDQDNPDPQANAFTSPAPRSAVQEQSKTGPRLLPSFLRKDR